MTKLVTDEEYSVISQMYDKFSKIASHCGEICYEGGKCPLDKDGECLASTFDDLRYALLDLEDEFDD